MAWTGDTTFTVTDGAATEACTADGMEGYEVSLGGDDPYELFLSVVIPAFEVVSTTEFNQIEAAEVRCEGDGCATLESDFAITLPCTSELTESWTHT